MRKGGEELNNEGNVFFFKSHQVYIHADGNFEIVFSK